VLVKELGQTGVLLPEVGMGTHNYHAGAGALRRGLEAGALFIDTAESYGTEEAVGLAVRGIRDRVFIATKVSPQHFHAVDFQRSVDASLRRLGIEVIDLLQLHYPNSNIPIEETIGAMAKLIEAGKVRFAGVSNFSVQQLQEAQRALGKHSIVSNQVRYNLVDRTIEKDLLEYCQKQRITVIAYSPLARDFRRIGDCDPEGVIDSLARATGRSPAQIAINWCLCKDGVVAIPKGNSEAHIVDNCRASDWRLTAGQISMLDSKIRHYRRSRFDILVRRLTPSSVTRVALRAVAFMPRSLRGRIL
jgi:diketogulonate reductase-like aldo/keto reductase